MKLLTYQHGGQEAVGVMDQSGEKIIPISAAGLKYASMNDLIQNITKSELSSLKNAVSAVFSCSISYSDTVKVAPIPEPRQDVICLGYNYVEHIKESSTYKNKAIEIPEFAIYFSKRVNRAVPDSGEILFNSKVDEKVDYESELAVIIGKDAKNVPADKASEYIFGYTIINDVSARTIQNRHKQFYFGKSMDGFTPMGPWIVTADEFSFPLKLSVSSYVNGELRQDSNTEHMLFSIPKVIEELSSGITLKAGTIISTGTPAGVGVGFTPPRFLKPGDMVECVIEGIGRLRNTVVGG